MISKGICAHQEFGTQIGNFVVQIPGGVSRGLNIPIPIPINPQRTKRLSFQPSSSASNSLRSRRQTPYPFPSNHPSHPIPSLSIHPTNQKASLRNPLPPSAAQKKTDRKKKIPIRRIGTSARGYGVSGSDKERRGFEFQKLGAILGRPLCCCCH